MSTVLSVRAALAGSEGLGQSVTVRGWVRSRRDSKAGISFLALNDGSCQSSIQAVVPDSLANYGSEVLQLSSGWSW
jgi:asparaginyl-tRNA synthetase